MGYTESLDRSRQDLLARHERLTRRTAALAERRFAGTAEAGRVRVILDGAGRVCEVRIDHRRLATFSAEELSRLVLEAAHAARASYQAALTESLRPVLATDVLRRLGGGR